MSSARGATGRRVAALVTAAALASSAAVSPTWGTPPPVGSACTITGTVRADTLDGTSGSDVICGLGGNDTISGLGGDDLLVGGIGDDTLDGGTGLDDLRGGPGHDTLIGGSGADKIYGDGDGDDIDGAAGADTVVGGDGDDTLTGGLDNDVVRGLAGADVITGAAGNDTVSGGDGADDVRGNTGADRVLGDAGDDDLYGGDDDDVVRGGVGDDDLYGQAGDDVLYDRDGNGYVDHAFCGDGTGDVANIDFFDVVAADCETSHVLDREAPVAVGDSKTVLEDASARQVDVLANDTDADGGPIGIASASDPAHGTVTVAASKKYVSYAPDANYCNTPPGTALDTFTYTLAPGGSTATVQVKVACRDDDTAATDDAATVLEDATATTIDVLGNDTDIDSLGLAIDQVSQPAHGTVVTTHGGADLTYEPDADYCNSAPAASPTDDFGYTLTNGGDTATVAVTVTCVDDLPSAHDDGATVAEDDAATTIDVLSDDDDVEGDPFTVGQVTQPANGTVAITHGGADLTYAPDADYCNDPPGTALDSFTYTLAPGGDSATVWVTVTCVTDLAAAAGDTKTIDEDDPATTIDVLANDSVGDTGPISITSVTQPAHGTVSVTNAGADLTYEPNANYCNSAPGGTPTDDFTYTLTPDGDTATVAVTVSCVDDKPTAGADSATVTEDDPATTIDVLTNDDDVEGDPFTIDQTTQPTHGTVSITHAGADLTYEPDADYCNDPPGLALDTFTYTLTPGGDTATVTMTVTCVPDPAVAADDTKTLDEDDPATTIDVLANDSVGDTGPISITSVTQPAHGTVTITNTGADLTYEPNADYCNSAPGGTPTDDFTYTLTPDGDTATVAVTVSCVDDKPTASTDAATVTEDDPATTIDVLSNDDDVEGDPFTIDQTTQPTHGTVSITHAGADLTYEPDADYCNDPPGLALDTFTYTLTPGGDTATVTMTVTCVTDLAAAAGDTKTLDEDNPATTIDVLANDSVGDTGPISITSVTQPAHGTVTITNTGADLTYEPNADYCNSAPGGTPTDDFTYTLTPDGDTATVAVTVSCVDDKPTASTDAATVTEDDPATTIDVLSNDDDVEGDPFTIDQTTQPTHGTVSITNAGADLTYEPDADYCNDPPGLALDTFTYTLTPGGDTATVSVTVTCVPDPAVAADDTKTLDEDDPATTIDVLANDFTGDTGPISITSVTQPAHGTVSITNAGADLTYEPNANYCNSAPDGTPTDDFTYTLTPDGDTATVAVTVSCVVDVPTLDSSAGNITYAENAAATVIDGSVTISNPDAYPVTDGSVSMTGGFAAGQDVLDWVDNNPADGITEGASTNQTVLLAGTGTAAQYEAALEAVTYSNTSDDPSTAPRTVTYAITTSAGSPSDAKGVAVIASDDPPVAVNDATTVLEDAAATAVGVLGNDTDVDAGPKTISSATDPANGTVVLTGGSAGARTGLTYQPDPNYCNNPPGTAPDTFTYALNGGSTATVSVTVTCVNDAPVADDETFTGTSGAIGNTALVVNAPGDAAPTLNAPKKSVSGDIIFGDTDIDGPGPLAVVAGTFATNDGGSITIEADGDFIYTPKAGTSCTDTSDFYDYTLTDNNTPTAGTDIGRLDFTITGCPWYVSNNAAGNSGTSTAPFDTLAQAEAASSAGQTIFVSDGDNTTTGYASGFNLKANQVLTSEAADLVIGGDTLWTGIPANRPTLTDNNADVVDLDDGTTVRGFVIDPQGTGGGIAGTTGDTGGGTIDKVSITDTGTPGSQPMLELDATTGTFTISSFDVDTSGAASNPSTATGVRLNNAGTVVFDPASPINLTTEGARALDATTGTSFGTSTIDAITVTASTVGAISLNGTSATALALGDEVAADLNLTTTGGTAFLLNSAANVTVGAGGTDEVHATGGPAADITGAGSFAFDDTDSTNSTAAGVRLASFGSGTFSAGSASAITGSTGNGFDVDAGTGNITYDGTISTSGVAARPVRVNGRTAGTVDFNGLVNATGMGISLTTNTGATVRFDGGVTMSTGGNAAFTATGGGTVVVTDPNGIGFTPDNTLVTSNGTALNVTSTTIGSDGLSFRSITAGTPGTGPANGVVLNATGTIGGLTVSGNSSGLCGGAVTVASKDGGGKPTGLNTVTGPATADCSGGTIQNATGDGISLTDTVKVSLTRMYLHHNRGNGIGGASVNGFQLVSSLVELNGDSAADDDSGIDLTNLAGDATHPTAITNTTIRNNNEFELQVTNSTGTLTSLAMSGDSISSDGLPINGNASSPHGNLFNFLAIGASTTAMSLNLTNSELTGNWNSASPPATPTATAVQCDHSGTGTMTCNISSTGFANNNVGPQGSVASNGNVVVDFNSNYITGTRSHGINFFANANPPFPSQSIKGKIRNNVVGTQGVTNSGSSLGPALRVQNEGAVPVTLLVQNNTFQEMQNFQGINVNVGISGSATGGLATNLTILNNIIRDAHGSRAITIQDNQSSPNTPAPTICVDMSGNVFTNIAGQAGDGSYVRLRELNGVTNVRQLTPTTGANPLELDDANTGNDPSGTKYSISGTPQFNQGACTQPPN